MCHKGKTVVLVGMYGKSGWKNGWTGGEDSCVPLGNQGGMTSEDVEVVVVVFT